MIRPFYKFLALILLGMILLNAAIKIAVNM